MFAVPFYIKYTVNGTPKSVKGTLVDKIFEYPISQPTCPLIHTIASSLACAKIQFRVSSLMNEVIDALSTVEVLSSFEYHDLLKSVSEMDLNNADPWKHFTEWRQTLIATIHNH